MEMKEESVMSHRLDKRQLEVVLDQLFKSLERQGLRISDGAKDTIKKEITNELSGKLTHDDINNVEVQKKLKACITTVILGGSKAEFAAKLSEFENLIKDLKDEDKRKENDPKLDRKLNADLALLKDLSKNFQPGSPKPGLKPDAFAKKMVDEMKLDAKKNKKEVKEEEMRLLEKQMKETLRNLFNDDPTISGEIPIPILGPIMGNLFGWTNNSAADPNALSLIVESATHNAGKSDYNGLENIAKINESSAGVNEQLELSSYASPANTPT